MSEEIKSIQEFDFNIGFERGLNEWRTFLKTGGYIDPALLINPEPLPSL